MLEVFSLILSLVLLAKFLEERLQIPFVLILIVLAWIGNGIVDLSMLGEHFHDLVYLMLPIILIPDVLGLSRSELKAHSGDIFYLSVVSVSVAIALAVGLTSFIDTVYHLSIGALLILFAPLMATDVVSVGAIFSRFRLPDRLKLYAEGESLFNDITAMIIFFFIALPFAGGESLTLHAVQTKIFVTITFSMILGIVFGLLGYMLFKFFDDSFQQFLSIYVMAGLSLQVAEEFHVSGILSVVVSLIVFKYFFDKEGHYRRVDYNRLLRSLNASSSSTMSFRAYKKEAYYLGLFANALIFIALANVVAPSQLLEYSYEIIYVFILTSLIRYVMVVLLIRYRKLPGHWSAVLTLSGMKGGLAIIMIVSLPQDFEYRTMFLTIVVGVVILSIFVYTAVLMFYLARYKPELLLDKARDMHPELSDVKELFKREKATGAYNEIMFEELVEKEIFRSRRYNHQFAVVAFYYQDTQVLERLQNDLLRDSDAFGKIGPTTYSILLANCDLDGAMIFVGRLENIVGKTHIAVAEYATGDTVEMLYEKLKNGLRSGKAVAFEV